MDELCCKLAISNRHPRDAFVVRPFEVKVFEGFSFREDLFERDVAACLRFPFTGLCDEHCVFTSLDKLFDECAAVGVDHASKLSGQRFARCDA